MGGCVPQVAGLGTKKRKREKRVECQVFGFEWRKGKELSMAASAIGIWSGLSFLAKPFFAFVIRPRLAYNGLV